MSARAPRRRAGARGCGCTAPSRASASAPTSTGSPASSGSAGFVLNDAHGVLLEVEGDARRGRRASSRGSAPRRRRWRCVERVVVEEREPAGERGFAIRESAARRAPPTRRSRPTRATCEDCLRELFDPADRRFRYPFINCTNCGPRFTIVRGDPLRPAVDDDGRRSRCARAARREYEDPADRRFHAQPNACPVCGPSVALLDGDGAARRRRATRDSPQRGRGRCATARSSRSRASAATTSPAAPTTSAAVAALRARKHREDKPFALMARSLAAARDARRARRSASASC